MAIKKDGTDTVFVSELPEKTWNWLHMNKTEVVFSGMVKQQETLNLDEFELMTDPLVFDYRDKASEHAERLLQISAARGSSACVVIMMEEEKDSKTIQEVDMQLAADASVTLYVVQQSGENATCSFSLTGTCGDGALIQLMQIQTGKGTIYSNGIVELSGKKSDFLAQVGYMAVENAHFDMNYIVKHYGVNTKSKITLKGVLSQTAFKLFRGTIDFKKGCAGSKGGEMEDVLLLGDEVTNQTIPLILCGEEDVEGNHGATIGRLDDNTLFYLGSRGFTEQEASEMIAVERMKAYCKMLPLPELQDRVLQYVTETEVV